MLGKYPRLICGPLQLLGFLEKTGVNVLLNGLNLYQCLRLKACLWSGLKSCSGLGPSCCIGVAPGCSGAIGSCILSGTAASAVGWGGVSRFGLTGPWQHHDNVTSASRDCCCGSLTDLEVVNNIT